MTQHYRARIVVQKEKPVLVPPGLRFTPLPTAKGP